MRNSETKFEDSMLSLTMVAQATDSESFSLDPAGLRRPLKSLTGTFPHFVHYEPSGNSAMTETESDVAKEKGNATKLI
jgi:hypothetical protein